jgi:hypothetical protein
MSHKKTTELCLSIFTLAIVFCSGSCTNQEQARQEPRPNTVVEQPVKPPPPTPMLPLSQPSIDPLAGKARPKPAPPKPEEVASVLQRAYQKAVVTNNSQGAAFVAGDFNGDGSEDIAISVKPNEAMLGEINSEFANWTLEDPKKIIVQTGDLGVRRPSVQPAPVRAEKGDTLLAIIHGVGPDGWRNPEAKQTYLLKNGAGTNMVTESAESLRSGKGKQNLPRVRGDAIRQNIGGRSGLIIWAGSKYAWFTGGSE